jgi:hypothetical protein
VGVEVAFAIGPKESKRLGPISVRGRDLQTQDLSTTVGSSSNAIVSGYGVMPTLRHGITTDVTDQDRGGVQDLWANLYRLRSSLQDAGG